MTTRIMHIAAEILRENATEEDSATAMVIAAAMLMTKASKPDESLKEKFLAAAELLSPVCPHCGKPTRYGVDSPETVTASDG